MCFNIFVWIIGLLNIGYLRHFKRNKNTMVVVLQQDEHSSVNNSRPGEEVTGTRKKGVTEILE